ncbi:hypothetical protein [Vulcanisaeta sp. JCM 16159]|uniref:hypothetical protein n=1 Tax=Vulcanisaeta sp. JCM 16159 TaxID=1295371 RepID=UPI000ABD99ED|nr:hypothetical protein [Vulcanisaeta sp. JCM 16159]
MLMRKPWYVSISDCLLCALESRFGELRRLGINDVRPFSNLGRVVLDLSPWVGQQCLLSHLII